MKRAVKALFEYARNSGLEVRYLREIPGYSAGERERETLLETLTAAVPPEGQDALSDYLEAEREADFREEQVLFQCGLSIGLELGRLGL